MTLELSEGLLCNASLTEETLDDHVPSTDASGAASAVRVTFLTHLSIFSTGVLILALYALLLMVTSRVTLQNFDVILRTDAVPKDKLLTTILSDFLSAGT